MLDLVRREPVRIGALAQAVIVAAGAFVAGMTAEQVAALTAVSTAAIAVLVRRNVTPTAGGS